MEGIADASINRNGNRCSDIFFYMDDLPMHRLIITSLLKSKKKNVCSLTQEYLKQHNVADTGTCTRMHKIQAVLQKSNLGKICRVPLCKN